ncbi:PH domain-containing protein [Phormidium sp. FACHB-592]|uniref:PH domain-containing protein n=1 Tax=Stenomitos frigidus AS-A4 TaxID=2933935 RepID=A0ABV0KJH7_9CYAN|nr:PH domain-containing protein [Leptolyngbya sp. FACHB-321]MBD2074777.1 PH domain-containing protein [Phormidium sp. FACHB-592]
MIDFQESVLFKLEPIAVDQMLKPISNFLLEDETVLAVFKTVRDQLVFTSKRIIAANVQGLTGKKVDYTSIPYSKIQTFSVESSGTLERDCEIEIYISSIGKIRFEIRGNFDVIAFNKVISKYVLA